MPILILPASAEAMPVRQKPSASARGIPLIALFIPLPPLEKSSLILRFREVNRNPRLPA